MKYSCEAMPIRADETYDDESMKTVKEREIYSVIKEKSVTDIFCNKKCKEVTSFKLEKSTLYKKTVKKIIIAAVTWAAVILSPFNVTIVYPVELILGAGERKEELK